MKNYNKARRKDRYYGIVIEEFSFIEWVCDNMRIIPTYKSKFSKKKHMKMEIPYLKIEKGLMEITPSKI